MKSMISKILVFMAVFTSFSAKAEVITCNWIDNSNYEEGYWRPATLKISIANEKATIQEMDYFERSYEPCYDGSSSCSVSFGLDPALPLVVTRVSGSALKLGYNSGLSPVDIRMVFSGDIFEAGEKFRGLSMKLYGTGGNIKWIDGDEFFCHIYLPQF